MAVDSENTPLLSDSNSVYERFSKSKKRTIVSLVSWSGLLPMLVTGSFVPLIPQIAKDLDSTGQVVSLAISISIIGICFGGLCGAAYSTFYGRRPVYMMCLPLLCIGSFGTALSRNTTSLMVWRFIQAFGASPGMFIGGGVIGDIFKLEERGTAMGTYFAICLLGPALAPPIGGFAAAYASWRLMQAALGIMGVATFVAIFFFLPETSHPGARGIDKMRVELTKSGASSSRMIVFVNPFRPLALIRSPNVLAVSIAGFFVLLTDFVLLVPVAYTIGVRYNITNEALIGACFIPVGIGNLVGAPLAGRISDRIVTTWRKRRNGELYHEDRLRATIWGASVLVPLSVLFSGLLIQYVPGPLGLALTLMCFFMNGVGVDTVLSPSASYLVDILHDRSAEVMAASSGLRTFLLSIAVACIIPLINNIGVAATYSIAALLAWLSTILILLTIRYGAQMRHWQRVDIGYSKT